MFEWFKSSRENAFSSSMSRQVSCLIEQLQLQLLQNVGMSGADFSFLQCISLFSSPGITGPKWREMGSLNGLVEYKSRDILLK
jgi:hypothetical protein